LTPGGLWDSSKYEIKAMVKYDGKVTDTMPLDFAGPSTFKGGLKVTRAGSYEIIVYAFDPLTGNSGVDKMTVVVD
jgi:hypothetical protein